MVKRLIEADFPLEQASLDSVHEKNVRHGHIATLHIWPARRPLAAARAALIATLLPNPGTRAEQQQLVQKLGGTVVKVSKAKKLSNGRTDEKLAKETQGGILHWGRETVSESQWFQEQIKEAYNGQAPVMLDPFAGGGTIPLEAMRLGCQATAIDINPVAYFILKCTIGFPQKLAGQRRPLPQFALDSSTFLQDHFKAVGKRRKTASAAHPSNTQAQLFDLADADLVGHIRAWGWWVLKHAREDLEQFYPKVDNKPTVAYLWARTIACKTCRADVPILKTRWLCKKHNKRILLTLQVKDDQTGVSFGIQGNVPQSGGNAAQRRVHDKQISAGTMSQSGATCPCCGTTMTKRDMQMEGVRGRLGTTMTAVVVDGPKGKEYRLPTDAEINLAKEAESELERVFAGIPFGRPNEPLTLDAKGNTWCMLYGLDSFDKLFTPRQLLSLGTFVRWTRAAADELRAQSYPTEWVEAIVCNLACVFDKLLDHCSVVCSWNVPNEQVRQVFARFALPFTWDFVEVVTTAERCGAYSSMLESSLAGMTSLNRLVPPGLEPPTIKNATATDPLPQECFDVIVTDPPYYDAIGYSVLMDFFYVWLRRILYGVSSDIDLAFQNAIAPKWDSDKNEGELIDDASRFSGDKVKSKVAYEKGMATVFRRCHSALKPDGRLTIVFAHKHPDAWESLVSAIVRAGFTVDGSWPIQTERGSRTRALSSAALASSVWLICKKRSQLARPGWDNQVLEEMEHNIAGRLRVFWDAGIRGPDFVWAATGPALEAYSKHPVVRKADVADGQVMSVSEFLSHVRRIVVNFVVGRVLSAGDEPDDTSSLDSVTTYYLLHRHDFKLDDAPIGACILYAVSCGLSDKSLIDQYDILTRTGGRTVTNDAEEDEGEASDLDGDEQETETNEGTGSVVRLKAWQQRQRKSLGYDTEARTAPLIDQVHRLMGLWKSGDVNKVNEYIDLRGLRRNSLFPRLLQALIESAQAGSEERSLLESISNHMASRGMASPVVQHRLAGVD